MCSPGRAASECSSTLLVPFLARPYVDLALDPEFAMAQGGIPGNAWGPSTAKHVNSATGLLRRLVDSLGLPPKVLIIHRLPAGEVDQSRPS